MRSPASVVIRPVVTEKVTKDTERYSKYAFAVDRHASKIEIKKAVEKLFGVEVVKVNTITMRGKTRRVRFRPGKTPDWKKALVTLKEGQKIEIV